jgi:hypothetical protein
MSTGMISKERPNILVTSSPMRLFSQIPEFYNLRGGRKADLNSILKRLSGIR